MVEIEPGGNAHHLGRRQRDALARRAVARIGQHPVADLQRGDALAHALDHAGAFGGRRERERRLDLILAGDDQSVEKIQRRRMDADHHFAVAGGGIGHVSEDEIVGRTIVRAEQGFHG